MMPIFAIGHADNVSKYQMIVEAYETNNPCINSIKGNRIVINPESTFIVQIATLRIRIQENVSNVANP